MALISMEHVSKIYPNAKRPALQDIDLEISRGEFVFLVGASGSGKTSLLRLLLREEEATSGEIRVGGYDLRRLPNRQVPQYRRSIGMVFQDYKLLNNKNCVGERGVRPRGDRHLTFHDQVAGAQGA